MKVKVKTPFVIGKGEVLDVDNDLYNKIIQYVVVESKAKKATFKEKKINKGDE